MVKLAGFLGATVGGWLGWVIGARISFFTAFFLSIIGTGAGLYLGRQWARQYF
ncbi:MAG: hypothetical protein HY703_09125 [Gemmatimonadetes bacterium]|nr:hypothetical protein [Gemmatimonadota bacterium]